MSLVQQASLSIKQCMDSDPLEAEVFCWTFSYIVTHTHTPIKSKYCMMYRAWYSFCISPYVHEITSSSYYRTAILPRCLSSMYPILCVPYIETLNDRDFSKLCFLEQFPFVATLPIERASVGSLQGQQYGVVSIPV